MPRKYKKRTKRKKTGNSKSYNSGWYLDKASKALSVAYAVKSLLNVEKKKYDASNQSNVTPGIGQPFINFTAISQGDTISSRDGNSIKIIGLSVNYGWRATGASTSTMSTLRVTIVKDNQQISDSPNTSYTTLFESTSVHSHLNKETVGRFTILYDKMHTVSNNNGTAGGNTKVYIPLQHHVRYNGVNPGDIQKGGIYMYVISDDSQGVALDCKTRTNYVDN